jgi:hypothetical protein
MITNRVPMFTSFQFIIWFSDLPPPLKLLLPKEDLQPIKVQKGPAPIQMESLSRFSGGKVLKWVKRFLLFIKIKLIRKKPTTPAGE